MKNARQLAALVAIATITSAATAINATEGVSPGAGDRLAVIRDGCTTFSWGEVDGAAFYEVVAYQLPESKDFAALAGVDLSQTDEVLYTRVAGKATAWTPELDRCFASGGSFVWFVRAVFDENASPAAGDWSQGLFFSVAAAPSAQEVRQALGVMQRYLAEGGDGGEELAALISDADLDSDAVTRAPHRSRNAAANKLDGRVLPGTAAIRGEQVDPTGETYGVYGITNSSTDGSLAVVGEATAATGEVFGVGGITASADGAGIIAFNAANGTDLVLGADGYSAHLTELGLARSAPGPVTFSFENSEPTGSMMLQIDGVDVVTTATDHDTVGGLSCLDNQIAKWNTVLGEWECSGDMDTDTLAGLSCASGELAKWNGAQWSCDSDLDTDTLAGLSCGSGQVVKWDGSTWGCAPDLDSDASGLRGSRVWLLPYWQQGGDNNHYTDVRIANLGSGSALASCRWFSVGTPVLERLDFWIEAGGHGFCNTQSLGDWGHGWMAVESGEPVFADASISKTNIVNYAISRDRNAPMIPIDCSSPQGYEFVCAALAE